MIATLHPSVLDAAAVAADSSDARDVAVHEALSDVRVISNDLSGRRGFTLTTIQRNEHSFLPAFLSHYRRLGVERFIVLDDQSDDGSREYLAAQSDVMVLGSARRYGERTSPPDSPQLQWSPDYRVGALWRQHLLDAFGRDEWSLHLDLDEFVFLPEGMTFPDLATRLDPERGEAVWAVMLDAYPRHVRDLEDVNDAADFRLDAPWWFDGRPHLRIEPDGSRRMLYAGARSRLFVKHGLRRLQTPRERLRWLLQGRPPSLNVIEKPVLQRWRRGDRMLSAHGATTRPQPVLLPMLHFKFTAALFRKAAWAMESGAYYRRSGEYGRLTELLSRMTQSDASFLGGRSRLFDGWSGFARSGNAIGVVEAP